MSARFAWGAPSSCSGPLALPLPACGERVGGEGSLGWAHDLRKYLQRSSLPASLRIAERPPHPRSLRFHSRCFASAFFHEGRRPEAAYALPARRGEVTRHHADKQNRPRDAHAPELCLPPRTEIDSPPARGRRSAERRMPAMCRALRTRARTCAPRPLRGCAPLSEARPPSGASAAALVGALTSRLSSRPCFLGLGIKRALPPHPVPVQ
jgi:hypothetical protein